MDRSDSVLLDLLDGNDRHVDSLPTDYFAGVETSQEPAIVSICCSDSRVPQERMWGVSNPGWIFTPSNIGNQVWDEHEGEAIVDGSVLYPLAETNTRTVAVVGHTGCGAVTAAYRVAKGIELDAPIGVRKWIDMLVPVVEAGLASPVVDENTSESAVVNQLVEFNVDYQAQFLRDSDVVPEDVSVYGFVYDFAGAYGADDGRAYLVNLDGETNPDAIADQLPAEHERVTHSLLY